MKPSTAWVRVAERLASKPPVVVVLMPSTPQPCEIDRRLISHCGTEPLVAVARTLPLRSATVLIGESAAMMTEKLRGAPAYAATAIAGEPFIDSGIDVPPARPISMLLAISACWNFASPGKTET